VAHASDRWDRAALDPALALVVLSSHALVSCKLTAITDRSCILIRILTVAMPYVVNEVAISTC
jgi:hypothetical protein